MATEPGLAGSVAIGVGFIAAFLLISLYFPKINPVRSRSDVTGETAVRARIVREHAQRERREVEQEAERARRKREQSAKALTGVIATYEFTSNFIGPIVVEITDTNVTTFYKRTPRSRRTLGYWEVERFELEKSFGEYKLLYVPTKLGFLTKESLTPNHRTADGPRVYSQLAEAHRTWISRFPDRVNWYPSSEASHTQASKPSPQPLTSTRQIILDEWTFKVNLENETVRTLLLTLTEDGVEVEQSDFSGKKRTAIRFQDVSTPIRCDGSSGFHVQGRGAYLSVVVNPGVGEERQRLQHACEQIAEQYSRRRPF